MTAPAVVRALDAVLTGRERRSPHAVRTSRVVGRNDDGTLRLQRLDGECTARGCVTAEGEGELVRRPAGACWGNQGTTGVALAAARGSGRVLWVERLDPDRFSRGQAVTVTVHGRGFTGGTVFDFLLPGTEEINPFIDQVDQRLLDAHTIEIDLEVSISAPKVVVAPLAYDDPESPF